MRERNGEYRPTWKLNRGQYDQPIKMSVFGLVFLRTSRAKEDLPKNRLGLARWLVDDRNPLVARVIVNRAWMKFFGRGLVDPPDNFGVQGPRLHTQSFLIGWRTISLPRLGPETVTSPNRPQCNVPASFRIDSRTARTRSRKPVAFARTPTTACQPSKFETERC